MKREKNRDELNSINWVHAINYGKWKFLKAKQEREESRNNHHFCCFLNIFFRSLLILKLALSRLLFAIKSLKIIWLWMKKYVLLSIILIVDGLLIVYRIQTNKQTNAKRHIKYSAQWHRLCEISRYSKRERVSFKPWLSKRNLNGFNLPH